jgi:hypothetical protein
MCKVGLGEGAVSQRMAMDGMEPGSIAAFTAQMFGTAVAKPAPPPPQAGTA